MNRTLYPQSRADEAIEKDGRESLGVILLHLRKLREGVLASRRMDTFAVKGQSTREGRSYAHLAEMFDFDRSVRNVELVIHPSGKPSSTHLEPLCAGPRDVPQINSSPINRSYDQGRSLDARHEEA